MLVLYLQIVLLRDLKSLETFVKIIEKCIFIRYKTILSRNRIIKIIIITNLFNFTRLRW